MAEKIKLEIVTPEAMMVSEEVDEITVTGTEGEFGVLPGHCHMLSSLKIGQVNYKNGNVEQYMSLGGGYAEVGPDKVTILAETAELKDSIDVERAKAAQAKAEEGLNKLTPGEKDYEEAEIALEKARVRLETANR
ncbi:MAG: F0F1 ATP synthase subunit epsilon [Deltaproteobacteria bacterium]|nr:F0F1 ATP synthase subunit epsilon [Deltaproteobacteria bacterium]